jgi:hypothetical protein
MINIDRVGRIRGTYVGRPSPLGNPFVIGTDGTRDEVIEKYRQWLRSEWAHHGPARKALEKLVKRYRDTGVLTLLCHCSPQRCHASVIADAIHKLAKRSRHRG